MTATEFIIEKKQAAWNELEALLNRPRKADAAQLNRLGYLYRRVTSDLAVARRDFPQDRCVPYLNELASRAHAKVYQTSPFKRGTFRQFFRFGFPTVFRENLSFIIASFLMFAIAFAASYWIGLTNARISGKTDPRTVRIAYQGVRGRCVERYLSGNAKPIRLVCDDEQYPSRFPRLRLGHHVHGRHCLHFSL